MNPNRREAAYPRSGPPCYLEGRGFRLCLRVREPPFLDGGNTPAPVSCATETASSEVEAAAILLALLRVGNGTYPDGGREAPLDLDLR